MKEINLFVDNSEEKWTFSWDKNAVASYEDLELEIKDSGADEPFAYDVKKKDKYRSRRSDECNREYSYQLKTTKQPYLITNVKYLVD